MMNCRCLFLVAVVVATSIVPVAAQKLEFRVTNKHGRPRAGVVIGYRVIGINPQPDGNDVERELYRNVGTVAEKGEFLVEIPKEALNSASEVLEDSKQLRIEFEPQNPDPRTNKSLSDIDIEPLFGDADHNMTVVMKRRPAAAPKRLFRVAFVSSCGQFHMSGRSATGVYRVPSEKRQRYVHLQQYKEDQDYLYYEGPRRRWAFRNFHGAPPDHYVPIYVLTKDCSEWRRFDDARILPSRGSPRERPSKRRDK